MAITAQTIVTQAATILQDTANLRWPTSELLGWLNAGQRDAVNLLPQAYTKVANVTLVAGTRQSMPTDGIRLLDVIRNMGTGGATPGNGIRRVKRQDLDIQTPGWHSAASSTVIRNVAFDWRLPHMFFVSPPATAGTQIEVVYSAVPPDVAALGNTITLNDTYANALLDYVLYRGYLKDAEHAANAQRAQAHYSAFTAALGVKQSADRAYDESPDG